MKHPLPAVIFTALTVVVAVFFLGRGVVATGRLGRSGRVQTPGRLLFLATLIAVLWSISGLIVTGEIAALLGWSNPTAGVAGIGIGAGASIAMLMTDFAAGRTRSAWQVKTGVIVFVAGALVSMVVSLIDPSAARR